MQRKQSVHTLIKDNLVNKIAFGQSKHEAKKGLEFGQSTYRIYAKESYDTYKKECLKFADWLLSEKGIKKVKDIEDVKQYAQEYLQERLDKGCSVWTVKTERSALGMLYNKTIKMDMPKRDTHDITRSRNNRNAHFARDGKYQNIYTIALATGGRRADIQGLEVKDFKYQDGKLYVNFECSKGGRNRFTYVREEYVEEVLKIVQKAKESGRDKVLEEIPENMDIHSLRREYAYCLYQDIQKDEELRTFLLNHEPPRREYRTTKNKDGEKITREVKRDTYKTRDGEVYRRDDVYLISRMLGHNRIDTAIVHYLQK